jgi:hypothetical protein
MRAQLIDDPIEHLDFHLNLSAECAAIERIVGTGAYVPGPAQRVLVEKSKGLCRQIIVPTVRDALILQCLSDALFVDIKGQAPSARSFFARAKHDFGRGKSLLFQEPRYGTLKAWIEFQKALFSFSKERKFVVLTDIANFYDTVIYSHLGNTISGTIKVRESVLDMLLYALSGLLWQPDYMPRVEIGLPQMNLDAPRMLAHCFLYELDEYLEKHFKGDFVRYMDDIDFGVDSTAQAKQILKTVDLILQTRHVRLNSGKTQILSRADALKHFRVRENRIISRAASRIGRKMDAQMDIHRERRILRNSIEEMYAAKRFDGGNGDKILKRLLYMAARLHVELSPSVIDSILSVRPSVRDAAFNLLAHSEMTPERMSLFEDFFLNPSMVDDHSYLGAARALVDCRVNRTADFDSCITRIVALLLSSGEPLRIRAALWLMSKYAEPDDLINTVEKSYPIWQPDYSLGRLVGGLTPVVYRSSRFTFHSDLLRSSRNAGAIEVLEFHGALRADTKKVLGLKPILASPNRSKPLGLTHAKFLMLLSSIGNPGLQSGHIAHLLTPHTSAWNDDYYATRMVEASGTETFAEMIERLRPARPPEDAPSAYVSSVDTKTSED